MKEYIVEKSFWVSPSSQTNWDATRMGREGIGIPLSLLESNLQLKIIIRNRGNIYTLESHKALDHHKRWNTGKTAPSNTRNLMVIIPVQMMNFQGITEERKRKNEEAKKQKRDMQKLTKKFCIALFEKVRETYNPDSLEKLRELIYKNYPKEALIPKKTYQRVWEETLQDYMSNLRKIKEWNKVFS